MKERFLGIAAVALFSASCAATNFYVFPPKLGPDLLQQCSRAAPESITQFWQPSAAEIGELERELGGYLKASASRAAALPLSNFHRQYVGFVRDGKKFIYGNFYGAGNGGAFDEATQAVVACDGGNAFWGIVYDLGAKHFEEPQFNGGGKGR